MTTDKGIILNMNSGKLLNRVVGHEITHVLEGSPELYNAMADSILELARTKGEYDSRMAQLTKLYEGREGYTGEDANAKIQKELVADLVGDYLFSDERFVKKLSVENRNLFQKIWDEVKYLCRVVTAGSKEARQLATLEKRFAELYRAETKNPTGVGGVKYSLNIKHTDGTVEELADARGLSNEQALSYLRQAKSGDLQGKSYIPVRKDTPQVVIETLAQVNEKVENRSLVMQVRKAQQAMTAAKSGRRAGKYGSNSRGHALSPEQIIEIVNNLDNPQMVVYQTNRHDMDGNPLPNNVAVFVEYSNNGAEGVAVIEFDSSIDPEAIGTEYGDTSYHTVVTVFEPDLERNGMEFDYAEELLMNPDNIELEIKRRQPERSATQANQPNTSNELPYGTSIRNPEGKVNRKTSLSEKAAEDIAPLPEDIARMEAGEGAGCIGRRITALQSRQSRPS